ncbi:hypothetical protein [Flammeovirga sp. OC4]|uniref:hypothetical protein n=1 Tax=Flammeovirga sp. OC4 TaxID=1382345 RepID=UPI0005C4ED90|nr:hypothetical protein [Flammeovirga sp. OC4]
MITFAICSYKIYEKQYVAQSTTTLMVDIQSTGLESKDGQGNIHQAFMDFDSICVNIISFQLPINNDTLYHRPSSKRSIDLLSFVSKDTVLWEDIFVDVGEIGRLATLTIKQEGNYLVDHTGNKYNLRVDNPSFDFELYSDNDIKNGSSYGIKLDFLHSVQVLQNSEGQFTLSQKESKSYQNGLMFLYKVQ